MRRELKDQLSSEKLYFEDKIRSELNCSEIIGNSAALRRVLKLAQTVFHARQQSDWVVAGPQRGGMFRNESINPPSENARKLGISRRSA